MAVTLYLFDPQLVCVETISDPAELIHREASFQLIAQFSTRFRATTGCCIGFKCVDGRFRLFEIDEIDFRDDTGDCYCTCTDRAVRELADIVVENVYCDGMTVLAAIQRLNEATVSGWQIGQTVTTEGRSTRHYYKSLWECFVHLMNVYNVRIQPYYVFDQTTNAITSRVLDVVSTAPVFIGRLIESGDGSSHVVVRITNNPKTAIYGRGKGEEIESESESSAYGRRITFRDVVWTVEDGYPVNKPAGQEWVGDESARALFGRDGKHRFGVVIFEDQTDPEQLLWDTWHYLESAAYPMISATATVYDLEFVKGYSWAALRIGHEVIIRPMQYPTYFRSTVTEIARNYVRPDATQITMSSGTPLTAGSIISNLQSNVTAAQQIAANVITRDSVIDTMVTKIMSSGTHMYTDSETGAWVFENATGTAAMMLTGGGWMIASDKTGDRWNWTTAATGEGIVADTVTTGTLQASLIKIFGSDHFFWDAENIYIKESLFRDITVANIRYQSGTDRTVTNVITLVDAPEWIKPTTSYTRIIASGFPAGNYTISWDSFRYTGSATYSSFYVRRQSNGSTYSTTISSMGSSFSMNLWYAYDSTEQNPNTIYIETWTNAYPLSFTNLRFYRTETEVVTDWSEETVVSQALLCSSGLTEVASLTAGKYRLKYDGITPADVEDFILVKQVSGTESRIDDIRDTNRQIDFTLAASAMLYIRGTVNLNEIRIGKYDGEHYGIGYTNDGGVTWQTAIDFNGLAFSGEAVSLRTSGGLVDIRDGRFMAYAGSQVSFMTDAFSVRNARGRSLISISSDENREGQVILGEDGFPVGFGGGFILPVKNGGTGYAFGQTHRVRAIPSANFGEDGDLAVFYAGANTSYSAFSPTMPVPPSFADSNMTVVGQRRRWNNQNSINSGVPSGYWAVGNDAGYPYGVYGTFTAPVDITGGLTLELTVGKIIGGTMRGKDNGTTLQAVLASQDGSQILASATFAPPGQAPQTVSITFNTDQTLVNGSTYMVAIYDISDQTTWSYALIEIGSIQVPAYSGSSTFGLFVKSGGSWHEIGGAS